MTHVTEHPTHLAYLNSSPALPMIAEAVIGFAVLATKWSVRKRTRRQLTRLTQQQLRDIGLPTRQYTTCLAKWRAISARDLHAA